VKVLSQIRGYGLASISCGLALALAWWLDAPTSCFFLAVILSSLYGGKGPGLFAVGLTALAFDCSFYRRDPISTWIHPPSSDSDPS
jgi:hypothetical protein